MSNFLAWISSQAFDSKAGVSNGSGNRFPINVKENGPAAAAGAASNSNNNNELDNKEFVGQLQII